MDKIRIGVVGVGHLGSLHAKMLSQITRANFVGVLDIDREKSARIAADLGCAAFTSFEALLAGTDAVTVAASTTSHYDIARVCLEHEKHVFIEKPITSTIDEARKLCALARERKLTLQVGHIERFNPAILALDRYSINPMFVESHRLAQFNPRGTDVAVVLDLMIHDIDIILSFVKSPVARIDASGVAVVSDSVDIANARLQFENGCVANVTASRISQRKMRKMRMFQQSEYISIDFSEGLAEVFRLIDAEEKNTAGTMLLGELSSGARKRKIVYEQPEIKDVNALKHELELFVTAIERGEEPIVSGEDGRRALEVAHSIMEKINAQVLPRE